MNRILVYMGGASRRDRERDRLQAVARDLTEAVGLADVVTVGRVFDDDAPAYLSLSVIAEWRINREATATTEIIECLRGLADDLQAAAARLEGGAA